MSECGRCRGCRWWHADVEPEGESPSGDCGYAEMSDAKMWAVQDMANQPLVSNWIQTAPDFGCVQFEPRP